MEKRKEEKEGEKEGLYNLLNSRQGLGSLGTAWWGLGLLVRRGGAVLYVPDTRREPSRTVRTGYYTRLRLKSYWFAIACVVC